MPVSADPDALSYPAQGQQAASAVNVPGPMPLGKFRAKLTAKDTSSPVNFTWVEAEPDLDGSTLSEKADGLFGSPIGNPAREMNGKSPPTLPWFVWMQPRIETDTLGVVFEFELGCCS